MRCTDKTILAAPVGAVFALLASCTGDNAADGPLACDAFEFRNAVYDCTELDRCGGDDDLNFRLACCECDRSLCNPDPSCNDPDGVDDGPAETCMSCHNGSERNDYAGPGQSNPHPFEGAENIRCTGCHGGDPTAVGKENAHVPPPPAIGDREQWLLDPHAYFNRLTLSGIDKMADYTVDGKTYTAIDYIQFVNPGDLRVVTGGRSCGTGGCHAGEHVDWVSRNPFGTGSGMLSGAAYMAGIENSVPESRGLYEDTAVDYGFRAAADPNWTPDGGSLGSVGRINEYPEVATYGDPNGLYENDLAYDANDLDNYLYNEDDGPNYANRVRAGSPLEQVFMNAVGITCGDCHLGSAGANNRYADFRSSGCTACHMEYSRDGRSNSTDPNVNTVEPVNPDAIAAPERPHVDSHQIRNVAKILPNGAFVRGISDYACVGCHQGSNRTVLQFWGIRLDQNQDVVNEVQYPANPENFVTTAGDERLYDPKVGNATFNGRVAEQYLLVEDYDGDGRDDTPPDVHHEAGLGCIDCHGSRDVHNGTAGDPTSGQIISRMDQGVAIECQSCHGGVDAYAVTAPCETYTGETADCGTDRLGNPLRHVTRDVNGDYWLVGRLDGARHFLPQTRDVVVDNGRSNPLTGRDLYTPIGSYAMGRADGNPGTGIGPQQANMRPGAVGFSHTDRMDCVSCHASWTNNCVGCHLKNQYDADPNNFYFSNITGARISTFEAAADFTYQTPVPFYLGVNSRGRIAQTAPVISAFYRYQDIDGNESEVFAFTDRNGNGNNPNTNGRGPFGALSHDAMMPHSIRARVKADAEGPRYCVACHLTEDALDNFGNEYAAFRNDMANYDFGDLDYGLLVDHIGRNPGNQIDSPIWVHMVAGLGSGLFLFDETGCPTNPVDDNDNRQYCPDGAPADNFNPNNVVYNLDALVTAQGVQNSASGHPSQNRDRAADLRQGATNPYLAGPMGEDLVELLSDPNVGVVLDSWFDADGAPQGNAAAYVVQ